MHPNILKDQRGVSLPSVLLAVSISAIIALAFAAFSKNVIVSAKALSELREKEDLRNVIRGNVDCAVTKARMAGSRAIILYKRNGEPVFQTNGGVMSYGDLKISVNGYTAATGALNVHYRTPGMAQSRALFTYAPFVCF